MMIGPDVYVCALIATWPFDFRNRAHVLSHLLTHNSGFIWLGQRLMPDTFDPDEEDEDRFSDAFDMARNGNLTYEGARSMGAAYWSQKSGRPPADWWVTANDERIRPGSAGPIFDVPAEINDPWLAAVVEVIDRVQDLERTGWPEGWLGNKNVQHVIDAYVGLAGTVSLRVGHRRIEVARAANTWEKPTQPANGPATGAQAALAVAAGAYSDELHSEAVEAERRKRTPRS